MIAKPVGFSASAAPVLSYVTHDKGGALTADRVEWAENVNCIDASAEQTERIWAQMVDDASELKRQAGGSSRGRKLKDPYGHYVLSWPPDENPSRTEKMAAARTSMNHLGYGRCQYRVVAHSDTDHQHVHVVVCRVHPEHGRAMGRKNDGERLRDWSLQYEKNQGRIRVKGRLEDNVRRQRHRRTARRASIEDRDRGNDPPPPSRPERRPRRRAQRPARDADGRPARRFEAETAAWAGLLAAQRAEQANGTADLAEQKRRRVETAAIFRPQRQALAERRRVETAVIFRPQRQALADQAPLNWAARARSAGSAIVEGARSAAAAATDRTRSAGSAIVEGARSAAAAATDRTRSAGSAIVEGARSAAAAAANQTRSAGSAALTGTRSAGSALVQATESNPVRRVRDRRGSPVRRGWGGQSDPVRRVRRAHRNPVRRVRARPRRPVRRVRARPVVRAR